MKYSLVSSGLRLICSLGSYFYKAMWLGSIVMPGWCGSVSSAMGAGLATTPSGLTMVSVESGLTLSLAWSRAIKASRSTLAKGLLSGWITFLRCAALVAAGGKLNGLTPAGGLVGAPTGIPISSSPGLAAAVSANDVAGCALAAGAELSGAAAGVSPVATGSGTAAGAV